MKDKSNVQGEITIVGAGIAGLTLALQLHASGFRNVKIYEASRHLQSLGVGINLQPSAVLVLRNLGLLPDLEKISIPCCELNFYDQHGNKILSDSRGVAAGYEIRQASMSRGEFQMLLLRKVKERLGPDSVHLGHILDKCEQLDSGVNVQFLVRGEQYSRLKCIQSEALIGADGINSTTRGILYPSEGSPKYSGRMLWRGCCEGRPYLTGASMVMAGHAKQFFLAYPIQNLSSDQQLINWVCCLRTQPEDDPNTEPPEKASWTLKAARSRFLDRYESWNIAGLSVKDIVNKTETVWEYPMCDRDPLNSWSFNRVTLLGDSAHPMYPIGGMGATQAILDAECLAKHLSTSAEITTALKHYQDDRLPPTSKIVLANRGKGNNEYVMELVHQRAPDGFRNIDEVISKNELEEVGRNYKTLAGLDIQEVNKRAKETKHLAERFNLETK